MTIEYSYCERVDASAISPWHIRRLSKAGRKLGGGIDTASLCGRITPRIGGWDLSVPVVKSTRLKVCALCEGLLQDEGRVRLRVATFMFWFSAAAALIDAFLFTATYRAAPNSSLDFAMAAALGVIGMIANYFFIKGSEPRSSTSTH